MTRYRKKPVEVEAWQVGSDEPIPDWVTSTGSVVIKDGYALVLTDLLAEVKMSGGSWFVREREGEIKIVTVQRFEQTYEVVE